MNNYKHKYLKYKKKYLDIKKKIQNGGFDFTLSEWHPIINNGQQNCGIFLSALYPNLICKCEKENHLESIDVINDLNIFPKIIDSIYLESENKTYTIMKKLDGDITSIFFTIIPQIVLKKMEVSNKVKCDLLKIFKYKVPSTTNSKQIMLGYLQYKFLSDSKYTEKITETITSIGEDKNIYIDDKIFKNNIDNLDYFITTTDREMYNNLLELHKVFADIDSSINEDLYDEFINLIFSEINKIYHTLIKEVIRVQYYLTTKNFRYVDYKFDNFGFILSDEIIADYITDKNTKLFNKNFYVYILDWRSGLIKITDEYEKMYYINDLIKKYNDGLPYYVNGQYSLTNFNQNIMSFYSVELTESGTIEYNNYSEEIMNELFSKNLHGIINKNYKFKIKKPTKILSETKLQQILEI